MRLLIVTEGAGAAEAIRGALRYAPSLRVIGYVDGRGNCGPIVQRERPDVIVVDLPGGDVHERLRELRVAAPAAKIIMLKAAVERRGCSDAVDAGADAVIAKTRSATVGVMIGEVVAGNVYHPLQQAARSALPHPRRRRDDEPPLTSRELEILRLVAGGMSNARIAATLFVTEQTVKFHLSNAYRKLGLANRTEASHYVHVNGLFDASLDDQRDAMEVAA